MTDKKTIKAEPRPPRKSKPRTRGARGAPRKRSLGFRVLYWSGVVAAWAFVGLILFGIYIAHDLPNVNELQPPEAEPSIVVLARDGSTWAFEVSPGGSVQRQNAIRLAVNLAMYVLCSDYKDDQVHAPWLMRRRARRPR